MNDAILDRIPSWSPIRIYLNSKQRGIPGRDNHGVTPSMLKLVDAIADLDAAAGEGSMDGWVWISQEQLAKECGLKSSISQSLSWLVQQGLIERNTLTKSYAYRVPWMHLLKILAQAEWPEMPDFSYWENGAGTIKMITGELSDDEWMVVNQFVTAIAAGQVDEPGWMKALKVRGWDPRFDQALPY